MRILAWSAAGRSRSAASAFWCEPLRREERLKKSDLALPGQRRFVGGLESERRRLRGLDHQVLFGAHAAVQLFFADLDAVAEITVVQQDLQGHDGDVHGFFGRLRDVDGRIHDQGDRGLRAGRFRLAQRVDLARNDLPVPGQLAFNRGGVVGVDVQVQQAARRRRRAASRHVARSRSLKNSLSRPSGREYPFGAIGQLGFVHRLAVPGRKRCRSVPRLR